MLRRSMTMRTTLGVVFDYSKEPQLPDRLRGLRRMMGITDLMLRLPTSCPAAEGDVDPAFGAAGKVTTE